jgi:hypothetical protein
MFRIFSIELSQRLAIPEFLYYLRIERAEHAGGVAASGSL